MRMREILVAELPDTAVTLSHEINPIPREYRRIIAAAIDASISPIIRTYVQRLRDALADAGFKGELLLANCLGGMMPPAEIDSAANLQRHVGPDTCADRGPGLDRGTRCDRRRHGRHLIRRVCAEKPSSHHRAGLQDQRRFAWHSQSRRALDWCRRRLDRPRRCGRALACRPAQRGRSAGAGLLRVGRRRTPRSPTPMSCSGYSIQTFFSAAGSGSIVGLAEQAVDRIARRLGVRCEEAAHAIYTTSNHNMVAAIEEITVREGINPRDSLFVCGGGGTSCHIAEMAEILGLKRYLIPRFVAGLSAFGGLISDLRWEENGTLHTSSRQFDVDRVNDAPRTPACEGRRLHALSGCTRKDAKVRVRVLRQVRIPVMGDRSRGSNAKAPGLTEDDLPTLVEAFHQMHDRIYSIRSDNDVVEFTAWKVRAIGARHGSDLWRGHVLCTPDRRRPSRRDIGPVYMRESGAMEPLAVYDAHALHHAATITGPCLIDATTFTAFLARNHTGTMDQYGNLLVVVR